MVKLKHIGVKVNLIKYKEAEIIDLSVEMDVVQKSDGWYIIGDGVLIKVKNKTEGLTLKEVLQDWFEKNRKYQ